MKVINLFGVPGSGKSTGAAYLFSHLKMQGYSCELVTEFAKDLVYEESLISLADQLYVLGVQNHRLSRLKDKVDYVIMDSPILLSIIYGKGKYPSSFDEMIKDVFATYENINFYIYRDKPYTRKGRLHNEKESESLAASIYNMLVEYKLPFVPVGGNQYGYADILAVIKELAGRFEGDF